MVSRRMVGNAKQLEKTMKHIIKLKNNQDWKSAYNPELVGQVVYLDSKGKTVKVQTQCGESKTDQSYAASHDINRLLNDAMAKGLLRAVNKFEGEMDDFPTYDFQEAQNMMAKASSMYEAMPANIRNKFGNAANFMDYVNNPANRPELEKMGFANGFDNLDFHGNIIDPNYGQEPSLPAEPAPTEPTPPPSE